MKCSRCGASDLVRTAEAYRYEESGLPNVTLVDVEIRRCTVCGERSPVIPRMLELHRVLAHAVITKHSRLSPVEVRFLRKYLGRSGQDFANLLGVTREQVSRWENGKDPIGTQADRLVRLIVAHTEPERNYDVDELSSIEDTQPAPNEMFRLRQDDGGWQLSA